MASNGRVSPWIARTTNVGTWRLSSGQALTIGQIGKSGSCAGYVDPSTVIGRSRKKGSVPTPIKKRTKRR